MRHCKVTRGSRTGRALESSRGTLRDAAGTIAIEFAVVLPLLLLFVLGLIDTGRLLWSYTMLSRSVAAASRCAAVSAACASDGAVKSFAAGQAWGLKLAATAYTVNRAAACGAQVQGTMQFQLVTPLLYVAMPFGASGTLTLNASACYPI